MLKFYALPVSGYCSKVRTVLRIKGIAFEEQPPLGGGYGSDAWREHMPPGSIPAIEDTAVNPPFKLFDSEAIVEYLDELVPEPPLLANDLQLRARQRALSQFNTGRLEPTVRALFPLVKRNDRTEDAAAAERFKDQLAMLERVALAGDWMAGDSFSLPDCSLPFTVHMGIDILGRLGQVVRVSENIAAYLERADAFPVLGEEIHANRAAVAEWLDQFQPRQ